MLCKYININSIYSKNIVIKKANYEYYSTTLKCGQLKILSLQIHGSGKIQGHPYKN